MRRLFTAQLLQEPTGGGTFVSASGNLQKGSYSKIEAGEEEG